MVEHPGIVLEKLLNDWNSPEKPNWQTYPVATKIYEVIDKGKPVTETLAIEIQQEFGINKKWLLEQQKKWDEQQKRVERNSIQESSEEPEPETDEEEVRELDHKSNDTFDVALICRGVESVLYTNFDDKADLRLRSLQFDWLDDKTEDFEIRVRGKNLSNTRNSK